jgi:RHH-type proline utilization regulon transcriptional repressor/proline dehydrogenase/delta 1-pyrroline-5-carboxylate dehydrogenase
MAAEAGKTLAEGDTEVSEAVDFARYYAAHALELDQLDGAEAEPLGVVAVAGPWNFPLAIPSGGVLAALAAGNGVVLKPAPQTPGVALAAAQALWDSGIPTDALHYARCADGPVGSHLIAHPGISGLVLTGSYETAELFSRLAPNTPLFAETSGKNAIVVMPEADLDEAAADLARSAFGHAGQKCSAASLAILVGETANSVRFRSQLVDAARSLDLGPATSAVSTMGPLIEPPPEKLQRALTTLERHQHWLLEPRRLNAEGTLWSPGIVDGVSSRDWFARTECFGPVLGLVAARDLDHAVAIQNALPFGLTGGICSLDPGDCASWVDRVEVGNAYVNRAITGAIVGRQPFGGWKRSVVGPGAKAGGPNYVLQLCRVRDRSGVVPVHRSEPSEPVGMALAALRQDGVLSNDDWSALEAAASSDAHWWATEFGIDHDPEGLFCEANRFRYRPLPNLTIRVNPGATPFEVYRTLLAGLAAGPALTLSVHPAAVVPAGLRAVRGADLVTESRERLMARLATLPAARVRLLGSDPDSLSGLAPGVHVDARPPVLNGRVEMLRYLREQTVSQTLHRFGNVIRSPDA